MSGADSLWGYFTQGTRRQSDLWPCHPIRI